MTKPSNRIVITGLGAISTLGQTLDSISTALKCGTGGISIDEERRARGFRSALTGVIKDFDAAKFFDRKQRRSMGQPAAYGCAAAQLAVEDAKLTKEFLSSDRVGVIFGNDSTCQAADEMLNELEEHKRTTLLGTGHIIKVMNSTVTMNLSTLFQIKGLSLSLSAACASGLHALGLATLYISQGLQDAIIVGGAQETSWQSMAAFDALSAFSMRESEPSTASRPFDVDRDGLVPSGGGAALIVESLEHAQARGARIYSEVLGYGFSCDGDHLTLPTGDGAYRAMHMAMSQAEITPKALDFVYAHATSTPQGDAVEAQAISRLLEGLQTQVASTKGLTGHECWMSGASETVYANLMFRDGFIAGNSTLIKKSPEAQSLFMSQKAIEKRPEIILKNAFGFGGTNASVVLRRFVK